MWQKWTPTSYRAVVFCYLKWNSSEQRATEVEASTYCTYYIPAQDLSISSNVHNSFLQTHVGGPGQPCQDHWFVLAKVQRNHTVPSHMASSPGNCGLQAELRACLRHVARTHVHKHQHVSCTLTGGRAFWPHRCSCVYSPLTVSFQNTNGPCLEKAQNTEMH